MRFKLLLSLLCGILSATYSSADTLRPLSKTTRLNPVEKQKQQMRQDCAMATASVDLTVNNVRARLRVGGDLWWDGTSGRYIVPKVSEGSGLPEVSSIFASGIWIGGVDPGNNLKLAAQTYGSASGNVDYWPGPLNDFSETDSENCNNWDRFFSITSEIIYEHRRKWSLAVEANGGSEDGVELNPEDLAPEIKAWPALGNPFFEETNGFALPPENRGFNGLANFWDVGGVVGVYEPHLGDYPIVSVGFSNQGRTIPDQIEFWIFNDAGGLHTESNGDQIGMEIQAHAFAYHTSDHLNNTTFQQYRFINRAVEDIDSTYIAFWVDPDLGCFRDDFIGCDTTRNLAYVYNADALDGDNSCFDCGVNTYCTEIPILGIDILKGPLDEYGNTLEMSSFTYYDRQIDNIAALTAPQEAIEYYNYMSGSWRDGSAMTWGGTGYNPFSSEYTKYAFTGAPNDPTAWSMCAENFGPSDPAMIMSAGPFRLKPGSINRLASGIIWVPDLEYPCPDITRLLTADDRIQLMFSTGFEESIGPEPPAINWVELDGELIALIDDELPPYGESVEDYIEIDYRGPGYLDSTNYLFEGYQIFQTPTADIPTDLDDPDQARLVAQTDVANGVGEIYNWKTVLNPNRNVPGEPEYTFVPELMVAGDDEGLRHSFRITEDAFAGGPLINHRTYHYVVRSYGHNNWKPFVYDKGVAEGQQFPFISSGVFRAYSVVPRPITDRQLQSQYGDGPTVTRLDGLGVGDHFVELSPETSTAILEGTANGKLEYLPGQAPIKVEIFDPLQIQGGTFQLAIRDSNMEDEIIGPDAYWELTDMTKGEVIGKSENLTELNEELIDDYGFSISIVQTADAGDGIKNNGVLGVEVSYADSDGPEWFSGLLDGEWPFDFVDTEEGDRDFDRDPEQSFTEIPDPAYWVPFTLTTISLGSSPMVTPMLDNAIRAPQLKLRNEVKILNNVDIVLTKDKSKWSRCMVVESATRWYKEEPYGNLPTEGIDVRMFRPRPVPSVTKYADATGQAQADPNESRTGLGWFPGYAIDVETGERLNIFFGENSTYSCASLEAIGKTELCDLLPNNGRDMLWNPSAETFIDANLTDETDDLYSYIAGGQHYIYVTNQTYDACEGLYDAYNNSQFSMALISDSLLTWTCIPLATNLDPLGSGETGLIPNDLTFKLRVSNPYQVSKTKGENNGYPLYEFSFDAVKAEELVSDTEIDGALDQIRVVPNPYYYYSVYETTPAENIVKITNLPAQCEVSIYTLSGHLVRYFQRNETMPAHEATNQIYPDLDWDLKSRRGQPVSSGTYLIHVAAENLGERVLKAFVVQRPRE